MSKLPIASIVESIVDWLETYCAFLFDFLALIIEGTVDGFSAVFHFIPPLLLAVLLAALAYRLGRWPLGVFALVGLLLIQNLELWDGMIDTLALVMTSAVLSIVIGLPVGILCAKRPSVSNVMSPMLDFMQTMPAFVYLIPAVAFFGLGVVPGVIASVIFSVPPTIRLTNLGIRQVPSELTEAADSFGSTGGQKLFKVQLPLAMPTIMAGINQTIMLSLSMVVIAAMIGAQGLGTEVYRAVTQLKIGEGFEAGLAVVIVAILLDRLTQKAIKTRGKSSK